MMPVRPLHADPVDRIAYPVDLPGNCPGQEVKGNSPLGHGSTLWHLCALPLLPGVSLSVFLVAIIILIRVLLCFPGAWPEAGAEYLRLPGYLLNRGTWLFFFTNQYGILPDSGRSVFSSVCGFYAITSFGVNPKTG